MTVSLALSNIGPASHGLVELAHADPGRALATVGRIDLDALDALDATEAASVCWAAGLAHRELGDRPRHEQCHVRDARRHLYGEGRDDVIVCFFSQRGAGCCDIEERRGELFRTVGLWNNHTPNFEKRTSSPGSR